jgi:hypothetical protein
MASFVAFDRARYLERRALYRARAGRLSRRVEPLWPFVGAWRALSSLATIRPDRLVLARLARFPDGLRAYAGRAWLPGRGPIGFHPGVGRLGGGGAPFYDDNGWVGLCLLYEHRRTSSVGSLALARRVAEYVLTGWSDRPDEAHPGGIRWRSGPHDRSRNTCANGPAIALCVELAVLTGDEGWLEWAKRIYRWTAGALRGADHLYRDAVDPEGRIDEHLWSYNQGTMIGGGVLLARATGDDAYRQEAVATALATVAHFDRTVLLDEPFAFPAVLARNLLLLDEAEGAPGVHAWLGGFAEAVWRTRRVPADGRFVDPHSSPLNAAAGATELFALLAGAVAAA